MIHELKILPQYFEAVLSDNKPFEIRKNDRNFQVGDQAILKEYSQECSYTGRKVKCDIVYVMTDSEYVKEGFAVLGIKKCDNIFVKLPCNVGDTVYVIRTYKKRKKVEYEIVEGMIDCFRIGDLGKPMADICLNDSNDWLLACDESEYYITYEQAISHLKKEIETQYIKEKSIQ